MGDHKHRERLTVERGGEEIEVWNYLNVTMAYQFRGGSPVRETFTGSSRIEMGGGGTEPDYVTSWIAEEIWHDLGIDLFDGHDDFDVEVVDVTDDDVKVR